MAHSSTMHSIDEYVLRSQYSGGQGPVNSHTYYRFQPHSGTLLHQHSHALQLTGGNTNASDSLALTEMSLVNSGQMETNSYYSASNPTYPPDPSAILHHAQHPPSDLMTNAFTYNVNTSSASSGLYPISTDLVAIANSSSNHHHQHQHQHQHQNQHQHQHQQQQHRTYTEIGQCNPGATDLAHVTTLGPMVGHCLDSLSSSTSDKTAEVDDEWHLPKHHTMMLTRNGPLPHSHSQSSQQPYMSYVRSNEVS